MVKRLIIPVTLVLKLLLIYFVTIYAYRELADEDIYYEHRGNNQVCQRKCSATHCRLNDIVCKENKFGRFIYLYLDSLPLDLFDLENEYTKGNSKLYEIKHYGINDSGPIFSSVSTGKQSNKYEGSITHVDNVFHQFKNAGFKIKAFGYNYPIAEMATDRYFESYQNLETGLHGALCPGFFNLKEVTIENLSTPASLMQDSAQANAFLKREYKQFKRTINKRKKTIFKCLESQFADGQSLFLYDVYTDTIGHEYSRQSKIYLRKIAALKANLDVFFEFIQKRLRDSVAVVFSDHGLVRSLWESEVSNHGAQTDSNAGFLFIHNSKFIRTEFDTRTELPAVEVPAVFSQLLSGVNIPSNYLGIPTSLSLTIFQQMMTLRMKELQVLEYLATFPPETLAKENIDVAELQEKSAFHKYSYMVEHRHNLDGHKAKQHLKDYEIYVKKIVELQKKLNKSKDVDKHILNLVFDVSLIIFFLIESFSNLLHKMIGFRVAFTWSYVGYLSIPLLFVSRTEVLEKAFVFVPFLLMAAALAHSVIFRSDFEFSQEFQYKFSALIGFCIACLLFNDHVSQNEFYYMFYQNWVLQGLVSIVFAVSSVVILYVLRMRDLKGGSSKKLRFLHSLVYLTVDVVAIAYEVLLATSTSFLQTHNMQRLSQVFYSGLALLVIMAFFEQRSKELTLVAVALKLVFWLGHNYTRLLSFLGIIPFALLFKKIDQIFKRPGEADNVKTFRKVVNFCSMIYTTYFLFYITKGRLDTNISVRAGNRNWGLRIEDYPLFTAAVFMINKFLIFILSFFVMIYLSRKKSDFCLKTRGFYNRFITVFDSAMVRLSESWYFMGIVVYLETFKTENQRGGMMFYTSGIIMLLGVYLYSFSCCVTGMMTKQQKYRPVGAGSADSSVVVTRKKSRSEQVKNDNE